ncbi:MAG TPA: hypothetical protein VMU94_04815, partial [Streptosporangiaceae bacterium]|nr:hypothetical protein [Streptosporangiaceae bacterium]
EPWLGYARPGSGRAQRGRWHARPGYRYHGSRGAHRSRDRLGLSRIWRSDSRRPYGRSPCLGFFRVKFVRSGGLSFLGSGGLGSFSFGEHRFLRPGAAGLFTLRGYAHRGAG